MGLCVDNPVPNTVRAKLREVACFLGRRELDAAPCGCVPVLSGHIHRAVRRRCNVGRFSAHIPARSNVIVDDGGRCLGFTRGSKQR